MTINLEKLQLIGFWRIALIGLLTLTHPSVWAKDGAQGKKERMEDQQSLPRGVRQHLAAGAGEESNGCATDGHPQGDFLETLQPGHSEDAKWPFINS